MTRRGLVLIATLLGALRLGAADGAARPETTSRPSRSSCLDCHAQLEDELLEPTQHAKDDIHFQRGLSCHDCHGGDPLAGFDGDPSLAHDPAKGWVGKPTRRSIPRFCGRCHANAEFMKRFNPHARVDQLSEYQTSEHGKRHRAGDERTAVCVDCHGVHGIRAVSDPRSKVHPTHVAETCAACHASAEVMAPYSVPTDQYKDYRGSVHARALYEKGDTSAPTCNDCHGSHGAVPPGVENIAAVCGSCHGREATLFRETEAKRGLGLSACIQCVICHGNHAVPEPTDTMIGVGTDSTCTGCHAEGEPGYRAAEQMSASLTRLQARLDQARELLDRAERAGMEVGPDRFSLQRSIDQLVEAKVLIHSFDLDRFQAAANDGIAVAEAGVAAGHGAFAELRYRRVGLGLSLVVIAAVIVALTLKVREIERPAPP